MSFPYSSYTITSSIENVPLIDSKNISNLISSYLFPETRYKYEIQIGVFGRGLNITYKAIIIAKDEQEFTDVFSCVMMIEGFCGAYLTYEAVLNKCKRIEEEKYCQDVPEVIYLYRYRDDNDFEEYCLWFQNGNYYEQYDRDEPEITTLYLYEQPDWYDFKKQLTNEKSAEIKNMLSLTKLGEEEYNNN